MEVLLKHLEELQQVCKIYKVDNLYTFGSILTDRFNSNSDIDFIVSISLDDPIEYAENYFNLKFELEKIFDRKIDLLEQKSLNNRVLEKIINREKKLVYERTNTGMA
ncbi:MAG: nucleotidyltransferase domain-containing protein [Saprospiraceae bacterium]